MVPKHFSAITHGTQMRVLAIFVTRLHPYDTVGVDQLVKCFLYKYEVLNFNPQ